MVTRSPHTRSSRRTRFGATAIALSPLVAAACFAVAPPDLPALPIHRPTILHDALVPPNDLPLTELPEDGTFIVPVQVDPNQPYQVLVLLDYDPTQPSMESFESGKQFGPSAGGVFPIRFTQGPIPDDGLCHRIEFVVADVSTQPADGGISLDTIDLLRNLAQYGDFVTWLYAGPTGVCPSYDAGELLAGPDASDGATTEDGPDSAIGSP